MGDLIVTCTSRHSRNRAVGERIGRGERLSDILGSMKQVAEGIGNCAIARELAHARGVQVPVTDEVHAVLHEGKPPKDAVRSLLDRDVKPE
jgi:glycerol-3-phosphate dehydrogenase (NAD(P)+)